MACINKSDKKYVDLQKRYGDFLASSYVRGNILNKKLSSDEFYIPTLGEVSNYFSNINRPQKLKEMRDALKINPGMDESGVSSILRGVITKRDNILYVVQGPNNRGPIERQLTLREIYNPNLNIVESLAEEFPNIFEVVPTNKPTVTIVKVTPDTTAELATDMQPSLDRYMEILNRDNGIQPNQFLEGDHFWQRVGNHLYTLVDVATGEPFLRNVNMLSGAEVAPKETPVNKENADAEIMDIRSNFDTEFWQIDFGLRGYNLENIINNLEAAKTQQEFDEQLANFKKLVC